MEDDVMAFVKYRKFNLKAVEHKLDKILNNHNEYEKLTSLPPDEYFKSNNGAYIKNTAFFIDMRNSSELSIYYSRRVIARYYRCYIYLVIAVLRSFKSCKEVNIVGDCVSSIFINNSQSKHYRRIYNKDEPSVINSLQATAMLYPLLKVLNYKFYTKYGRKMNIYFGVGIAIGRALIMKAGELSGNIHDIHKNIYLGNNVNLASHLCDRANKKRSNHYFVLVDKDVKDNCTNYYSSINNTNDTFFNHLSYCSTIDFPTHDKGNKYCMKDRAFYGGNFYKDHLNCEVREAKQEYEKRIKKS